MNCLHNVTYGCTVVTHGASQRCRKSRASQSCTRFAAAVRSSARRSRQDGSRLLRLPTPSLSISSTGRTIETGCSNRRREDCVHREAFRGVGRTSAFVRRQQRLIAERHCEPRSGGFSTAKEEAWVNGHQGWRHTIQLEYRFDRLLSAKLEQVYELLVPDKRWPIHTTEIQEKLNEQARRHLCSSVIRSAEGESDDRQSDGGAEGIRRKSRLSGAGW